MDTKPFENMSRTQIETLIDEWVICKKNAKRNREILKLSLLDGVSQERIAEEYGLTPRQIQNTIRDSLNQLVKHI